MKLLWLLIAFALVGNSIPLPAQAAIKHYQLSIPRQSLDSALKEFAKQTGLQVARFTDTGATADVGPLDGKLTVEEALRALLAESGLTWRMVNERTIAVVGTRSDSSAGLREHVPSMNTRGADPIAFRLAQVLSETEDAQPAKDTSKAEEKALGNSSKSSAERVLDEIVVTGTHIRGAAPAGSSVITVDREEIDKGGFATVQDVVRSLPQNFGGGPSEDTRVQLAGTSDPVARTNFTSGTALNLRGLGAGATLVLLDGRRFAPGGTAGLFVDVSNVPLAAIERIDVLPDGASAIYGSDAIGGVVNFVLRKNYAGAESQVRAGSVTSGGSGEYQFSQTFGNHWDGGSGLLSYEYYQREALPARAREQAASSDLRSLGGDNFNSRNGNPGTIVIGAQTWAIPRGQDGTALTPASFVAGTQNLVNVREGQDLLGTQQKNSLFGTVARQLTDRIELFADGLFTQRDADARGPGLRMSLLVPATNAFYVNPTGGTGSINVAYNLFRDIGGVNIQSHAETYQTNAGATIAWSGDWQIRAYGQYGKELQDQEQADVNPVALRAALADSNRATAFNPFGDGSFTNPVTLTSLRTLSYLDIESDIRSVNVMVDGSVWRLAGGETRLALGADHRRQSFQSLVRVPASAPISRSYDRDVTAGFAELFVPLVGTANARAGVRRLELSLAARHEQYNDFGDTVNPKIGAVWSPLESFSLRGTWGSSFKAPNLADLDESGNVNFIFSVVDPLAPAGSGGRSPVLIASGANADVKEERATSWTLGTDFVPLAGLSLSLTYFNIEYKDRIEPAPVNLTWLQQPEFADIVIRDPTNAQREAFCSRGNFAGNFGGGPGDCRTAAIAAIVDVRLNNTAITRIDGVDLLASYDFERPFGRLNAALNVTYLMEYAQALRSSSPLIDRVDTPNSPLDWRLRGSLSWNRNGWGTTAFANYASSYTDTVSVPNRKIDSWMTLDWQFTYESAEGSTSFLANTAFSLNVQNAFDKDPPFFNNQVGLGYDPTNADLRGRFVSLTVRKKW